MAKPFLVPYLASRWLTGSIKTEYRRKIKIKWNKKMIEIKIIMMTRALISLRNLKEGEVNSRLFQQWALWKWY